MNEIGPCSNSLHIKIKCSIKQQQGFNFNEIGSCLNSLKSIITYQRKRRHGFKDARTNCFCASLLRTAAHANSHATSCIERVHQVLKKTMIGQMAIAIALLGFNALGRSVTPTFLFRNRFYLQLSPHRSKMSKKNQCGKLKKIQDFCPRDMESCHLTAARCVKLWSLNANLFFEEPHQLTKFTY